MDYPNILITTSLSDNRVLFDEPAKFTAKLREYKTDRQRKFMEKRMRQEAKGLLAPFEQISPRPIGITRDVLGI